MILTHKDLEELSKSEIEHLLHDWSAWARANQLPPDHPASSNHPPNDPILDWDYWVALAGRGFGKALALDTPILTHQGWKTMGALTDEDQVYAPDGTLTRIITHPCLYDRECYELTLSDHTRVVCDGEHLWELTHMRTSSTVVLPTKDISPRDSRGRTRYRIPSTLPLQGHSQEPLPIDPYLLGLWLGDGTSSQGRITCSNEDLPSLTSQLDREYHITKARKDTCSTIVIPQLAVELKSLGLLGNKHLPRSYLESSIEDRISLVQGLIDTDGCITKRGMVSFTTIYSHLAQEMKELLSSLGLVVQVYEAHTNSFGKKCLCYRVKFVPTFPPARNPRKLMNYRMRSSISDIRSSGRTIKSITRVPSVPVRCITVEHPSRLYLITNSFIATHNTRLGAEQVLRWVDHGHRRIHIIAPTTADTRDVIVDGESGILNCAHPKKRPIYEPSKRRLTFPNGAIALLYSAEEPERLRGPQCSALWCDELAAWQYPQETWDQAMFGLRLGKHPQVVVTTTPKPIPLIRSLIDKARKDPRKVVLTTGSTYDNKANLASTFFTQVAQYEGTRLGRQELHAELIDPRESGIVRTGWLKLFPRHLPLPKFIHILQSYDTAFTEKTLDRKTKDPDPSAQSTWGIFSLNHQIRSALKEAGIEPPPQHIEYGVMLLDSWSDHLGFPELRTRVKKDWDSSYYGPEGDARRADVVLIEDKGSGISLRQELQSVVPVQKYNPGRADKFERLHAISHIPCQGMVFIPESSKEPGKFVKWADPLIDQVCSFPLVEHDDYVDTFSQAMLYYKDQGYLSVDPQEFEEEYADDRSKQRRNPYSA